jgi:ferredoxin
VSAPTPVALRLRVDPVACDAFGYCAELLPERFTLDEWGYPMVDDTPVHGELAVLARRAATACPRRAVRLEEVMPTGVAARQ